MNCDAIDAGLVAAYNFSRLLVWFALLVSAIWIAFTATSRPKSVKVAA
jgi:hypothetical protein